MKTNVITRIGIISRLILNKRFYSDTDTVTEPQTDRLTDRNGEPCIETFDAVGYWRKYGHRLTETGRKEREIRIENAVKKIRENTETFD